ncbi:MAG: hypothetical protein AAF961_03075 [Planctomycetota bacterium]
MNEPKRFAETAFPQVAYNRPAAPSRYGESEARALEFILAPIDNQNSVSARLPSVENNVKLR